MAYVRRIWLVVVIAVLSGLAMQVAPACAEDEPAHGLVAETMNSGGYTYILLDSKGEKRWFAIPESLVKVGDEVQVQPGMQMGAYTSPTLKRTFDSIEFSPGLAGVKRTVSAQADSPEPAQEGVKIAKAKGPNAYTVAEIFAQKEALNGKKVVVRGKVVKTSKFEGKNWLRIVDGSGSSKRGDHKLVLTSSQEVAQDEVVEASGTVTVGKSFGALTYEVVVEDASLISQGK